MARVSDLEALLHGEVGARLPGRALTQRPMFEGLCLMLDGNMLAGIREGRLMLRVGKAAEAEALALPGTGPMDHGGRAMPGYVWAWEEAYAQPATLARLTDLACAFTGALPAK